MIAQQEKFEGLLNEHYRNLPEADPLKDIRDRCWEKYNCIGLPTRKNEVYRYVKLRKFYDHDYQLHLQTSLKDYEKSESTLVFVNGAFSQELSSLPEKVTVTTLGEAYHSYGMFLTNHWKKALKSEKDPFALLNATFQQDSAFVYIPPKTIVEKCVTILFLTDAPTPFLMHPRVQVFVGAHSHVDFVIKHKSLHGENYAMNQVTDFAIEENAMVNCTQIVCPASNSIWHFDALRATMKKNSCLNCFNVTTGSATIRNDYHVKLTQENCHVHLNGLSMLDGKRESHTHVLIDHQAPHCQSLQLFKNVLNGMSRSSFEGKIYVHEDAQKTDAFQLNNNLLLSDRSSANTKPNLEIFADDVKASHGATVGQLDPEQMFYMKTRGFTEDEAKHLLVHSFCEEVIKKIPQEDIKNLLHVLSRRLT